jgi:hypothetical protein
VAKYHLVKQALKNDSPPILSTARQPWHDHNYLSVIISESSGMVTLSGYI